MAKKKSGRGTGYLPPYMDPREIEETIEKGYFTVTVDGINIEVTRKKVVNVNCRVKGDRALMSVPAQMPYKDIVKTAKEMAPWYRRSLAKISRKRGDNKFSDPDVFDIEIEGITIHVVRKDVKNFNMRIAADGTPQMSIPKRASKADAERVAKEHLDWFKEATEAEAARRMDTPQGWETGDTIMVWGEARTIEVVEGSQIPECRLKGDKLEVLVPIGATPMLKAHAVENFLYDELRKRVIAILDDCQDRVGKKAVSIRLRRMKSRWGSCTKARGSIRLNIALAECPPACTETVLCHELCHLWEANHGPKFYARLDLSCPNWRVNQDWLDAHAPRYPAY